MCNWECGQRELKKAWLNKISLNNNGLGKKKTLVQKSLQASKNQLAPWRLTAQHHALSLQQLRYAVLVLYDLHNKAGHPLAQ